MVNYKCDQCGLAISLCFPLQLCLTLDKLLVLQPLLTSIMIRFTLDSKEKLSSACREILLTGLGVKVSSNIHWHQSRSLAATNSTSSL